jgi:hypothetical protein
MIKKAFRDNSMSEVQIKLWYRRFKDGRESAKSSRRSGRPSTSRTPESVERVRAAINENRRLTVRELEVLGIPRTIVSRILTEDLGKKHVAAKFVVTGIFIMTVRLPILHLSCRLFFFFFTSPRSVSPPTAQIWLPATSGFSQKLKMPLKGRRFQTANKIIENATRQLMAIPKKEFSDSFEKWKERWKVCEVPRGVL